MKSHVLFFALFPFAVHSAVTSESLCFELSVWEMGADHGFRGEWGQTTV